MTSLDSSQHEAFMRRAIELAKRAWGDTHPNPMVGAVIVEDGEIVAEGWHTRAGEPHAEPTAISALGRKPKPGATLYVTLEPCCTHGRTPPCTEAIKAAGFARVVIGATDPNPAHAGHGYEVLRAAGIEVVTGVLAEECADLNLIFNHGIVAGSSFFALKIASTLDGRTATRTGESQWITGPEARTEVMRLRRLYPAIAVGSGTVKADNPKLTARLPEGESCPIRLVLDRSGHLVGKKDFHVFSDEHKARTIVVLGERAHDESPLWYEDMGAQVWVLPDNQRGEFLHAFKARCAKEKIPGVLVEPGALLGYGLADYLYHFTAPVLFADDSAKGMADGPARPALAGALRMKNLRRSTHGEDLLTRGHLVYP
jgi:diaminohydroxyphosphoribosylaminopyrimidine deaminase/5-amino-6-(5-phosphoribosylamino)uracil reductase